jgi:hypothetical protein
MSVNLEVGCLFVLREEIETFKRWRVFEIGQIVVDNIAFLLDDCLSLVAHLAVPYKEYILVNVRVEVVKELFNHLLLFF